MKQNEKEWAVFSKRFNASRAAIFRVAEFLHRERGLSVCIPRMELAPNVQSSASYSDKGDIYVYTSSKKKFIVDVKHKQVDFTCAEDYPFSDIMVVGLASAVRLTAYAYFIVNRDMTHAFVVKGDTKNQWTIENFPDKERGDREEKYMCSKTLGEFVKL
jgi:hypothetical protein